MCTFDHQYGFVYNFKVGRKHQSNSSYCDCFNRGWSNRHPYSWFLHISSVSCDNEKYDERSSQTHKIIKPRCRKPVVWCRSSKYKFLLRNQWIISKSVSWIFVKNAKANYKWTWAKCGWAKFRNAPLLIW
jgi:hypothetical protein